MLSSPRDWIKCPKSNHEFLLRLQFKLFLKSLISKKIWRWSFLQFLINAKVQPFPAGIRMAVTGATVDGLPEGGNRLE